MILPLCRIFFLLLLLFTATALYCQSPLSEETAEAVLGGSEKGGRKMVSSLLTSRAHYAQGEFTYSGSLGYSFLDTLWTDPEVTGDPLTGLSLGGRAAYGLTDRFALLGSLTGCIAQGEVETDFFGDYADSTEGEMGFFMGQLYLGGSYELIRTERFSLPLSLGLLGSYFAFKVDSVQAELSGDYEGSATATLRASNFTPAVNGALSAEYRFNRIAFKANAALLVTLTGLDGTSEVSLTTTSGGNETYETEYHIDPYVVGTHSLSMELVTDRHWKFKLDVSDFLHFGENRDNSVSLYTLGTTVSYLP
ncbi:MAG: hypothetical protein PQJ60_00575 [Spirochaetales bacterium]|nr:hypothetical protein [Spirochaetales bacterium]